MYTQQFRHWLQIVYLRIMQHLVKRKLHRKMLPIALHIDIGNMHKLRKHSIVLPGRLFANILVYRVMLS